MINFSSKFLLAMYSTYKVFFLLTVFNVFILFALLFPAYYLSRGYKFVTYKTVDSGIGLNILYSVPLGNNSLTNTTYFNVDVDTRISNSSIYKYTSLELIKVPKIHFLIGLKNQCFFVRNPPQNDGGPWMSDNVVLKCWPYFQLIGVEKCGTSDIYKRLHKHHHLLPMFAHDGEMVKEPLWYNGVFNDKYHNNTVGGYLSLMDNATHIINKLCPNNINKNSDLDTSCPYLIGDFSARTINHNKAWHLESENKNLIAPQILVSDKLHHINPDTKIIIMLRNPVSRLFSEYKFYRPEADVGYQGEELSPEDFHTRMVEAIHMWEMCLSYFEEKTCAYGKQWANIKHIKTGRWWDHNSLDRLAVSIYHIYLQDWLRVFPKENFLIIKMEEYSESPLIYLEKHVLPFLGLEAFKPEARRYLQTLEDREFNFNKVKGQIPIQMLDETKRMLENFFEPYNKQLANILRDDKFLWK